MKINIASTNRFHLLDLARELEHQGHEVCFYSYVPTKRCISFGLKSESCKSLLLIAAPFLLLFKIFPKFQFIIPLRNYFLDLWVAYFMKPCDVFIGLGIVYNKAFDQAKNKFGAITILEWGSKHILSQQKIMMEINAQVNLNCLNKIALETYEKSDYIAIASEHVRDSFIQNGVPENKLLINPYGVDLAMFKPTKLVSEDSYDLIMVGGWSLRKGCDKLIKVCEMYGYSLLHVGSIVDLNFPDKKNFFHVNSVDQKELINYYSKAKVFILLSREEGLAMVQIQAIACGLPIVCSKDTGGRDIKKYINNPEWILEVESNESLVSINAQIMNALTLATSQTGVRNSIDYESLKRSVSWRAYGKRYDNNLKTIYNNAD